MPNKYNQQTTKSQPPGGPSTPALTKRVSFDTNPPSSEGRRGDHDTDHSFLSRASSVASAGSSSQSPSLSPSPPHEPPPTPAPRGRSVTAVGDARLVPPEEVQEGSLLLIERPEAEKGPLLERSEAAKGPLDLLAYLEQLMVHGGYEEGGLLQHFVTPVQELDVFDGPARLTDLADSTRSNFSLLLEADAVNFPKSLAILGEGQFDWFVCHLPLFAKTLFLVHREDSNAYKEALSQIASFTVCNDLNSSYIAGIRLALDWSLMREFAGSEEWLAYCSVLTSVQPHEGDFEPLTQEEEREVCEALSQERLFPSSENLVGCECLEAFFRNKKRVLQNYFQAFLRSNSEDSLSGRRKALLLFQKAFFVAFESALGGGYKLDGFRQEFDRNLKLFSDTQQTLEIRLKALDALVAPSRILTLFGDFSAFSRLNVVLSDLGKNDLFIRSVFPDAAFSIFSPRFDVYFFERGFSACFSKLGQTEVRSFFSRESISGQVFSFTSHRLFSRFLEKELGEIKALQNKKEQSARLASLVDALHRSNYRDAGAFSGFWDLSSLSELWGLYINSPREALPSSSPDSLVANPALEALQSIEQFRMSMSDFMAAPLGYSRYNYMGFTPEDFGVCSVLFIAMVSSFPSEFDEQVSQRRLAVEGAFKRLVFLFVERFNNRSLGWLPFSDFQGLGCLASSELLGANARALDQPGQVRHSRAQSLAQKIFEGQSLGEAYEGRGSFYDEAGLFDGQLLLERSGGLVELCKELLPSQTRGSFSDPFRAVLGALLSLPGLHNQITELLQSGGSSLARSLNFDRNKLSFSYDGKDYTLPLGLSTSRDRLVILDIVSTILAAILVLSKLRDCLDYEEKRPRNIAKLLFALHGYKEHLSSLSNSSYKKVVEASIRLIGSLESESKIEEGLNFLEDFIPSMERFLRDRDMAPNVILDSFLALQRWRPDSLKVMEYVRCDTGSYFKSLSAVLDGAMGEKEDKISRSFFSFVNQRREVDDVLHREFLPNSSQLYSGVLSSQWMRLSPKEQEKIKGLFATCFGPMSFEALSRIKSLFFDHFYPSSGAEAQKSARHFLHRLLQVTVFPRLSQTLWAEAAVFDEETNEFILQQKKIYQNLFSEVESCFSLLLLEDRDPARSDFSSYSIIPRVLLREPLLFLPEFLPWLQCYFLDSYRAVQNNAEVILGAFSSNLKQRRFSVVARVAIYICCFADKSDALYSWLKSALTDFLKGSLAEQDRDDFFRALPFMASFEKTEEWFEFIIASEAISVEPNDKKVFFSRVCDVLSLNCFSQDFCCSILLKLFNDLKEETPFFDKAILEQLILSLSRDDVKAAFFAYLQENKNHLDPLVRNIFFCLLEMEGSQDFSEWSELCLEASFIKTVFERLPPEDQAGIRASFEAIYQKVVQAENEKSTTRFVSEMVALNANSEDDYLRLRQGFTLTEEEPRLLSQVFKAVFSQAIGSKGFFDFFRNKLAVFNDAREEKESLLQELAAIFSERCERPFESKKEIQEVEFLHQCWQALTKVLPEGKQKQIKKVWQKKVVEATLCFPELSLVFKQIDSDSFGRVYFDLQSLAGDTTRAMPPYLLDVFREHKQKIIENPYYDENITAVVDSLTLLCRLSSDPRTVLEVVREKIVSMHNSFERSGDLEQKLTDLVFILSPLSTQDFFSAWKMLWEYFCFELSRHSVSIKEKGDGSLEIPEGLISLVGFFRKLLDSRAEGQNDDGELPEIFLEQNTLINRDEFFSKVIAAFLSGKKKVEQNFQFEQVGNIDGVVVGDCSEDKVLFYLWNAQNKHELDYQFSCSHDFAWERDHYAMSRSRETNSYFDISPKRTELYSFRALTPFSWVSSIENFEDPYAVEAVSRVLLVCEEEQFSSWFALMLLAPESAASLREIKPIAHDRNLKALKQLITLGNSKESRDRQQFKVLYKLIFTRWQSEIRESYCHASNTFSWSGISMPLYNGEHPGLPEGVVEVDFMIRELLKPRADAICQVEVAQFYQALHQANSPIKQSYLEAHLDALRVSAAKCVSALSAADTIKNYLFDTNIKAITINFIGLFSPKALKKLRKKDLSQVHFYQQRAIKILTELAVTVPELSERLKEVVAAAQPKTAIEKKSAATKVVTKLKLTQEKLERLALDSLLDLCDWKDADEITIDTKTKLKISYKIKRVRVEQDSTASGSLTSNPKWKYEMLSVTENGSESLRAFSGSINQAFFPVGSDSQRQKGKALYDNLVGNLVDRLSGKSIDLDEKEQATVNHFSSGPNLNLLSQKLDLIFNEAKLVQEDYVEFFTSLEIDADSFYRVVAFLDLACIQKGVLCLSPEQKQRVRQKLIEIGAMFGKEGNPNEPKEDKLFEYQCISRLAAWFDPMADLRIESIRGQTFIRDWESQRDFYLVLEGACQSNNGSLVDLSSAGKIRRYARKLDKSFDDWVRAAADRVLAAGKDVDSVLINALLPTYLREDQLESWKVYIAAQKYFSKIFTEVSFDNSVSKDLLNALKQLEDLKCPSGFSRDPGAIDKILPKHTEEQCLGSLKKLKMLFLVKLSQLERGEEELTAEKFEQTYHQFFFLKRLQTVLGDTEDFVQSLKWFDPGSEHPSSFLHYAGTETVHKLALRFAFLSNADQEGFCAIRRSGVEGKSGNYFNQYQEAQESLKRWLSYYSGSQIADPKEFFKGLQQQVLGYQSIEFFYTQAQALGFVTVQNPPLFSIELFLAQAKSNLSEKFKTLEPKSDVIRQLFIDSVLKSSSLKVLEKNSILSVVGELSMVQSIALKIENFSELVSKDQDSLIGFLSSVGFNLSEVIQMLPENFIDVQLKDKLIDSLKSIKPNETFPNNKNCFLLLKELDKNKVEEVVKYVLICSKPMSLKKAMLTSLGIIDLGIIDLEGFSEAQKESWRIQELFDSEVVLSGSRTKQPAKQQIEIKHLEGTLSLLPKEFIKNQLVDLRESFIDQSMSPCLLNREKFSSFMTRFTLLFQLASSSDQPIFDQATAREWFTKFLGVLHTQSTVFCGSTSSDRGANNLSKTKRAEVANWLEAAYRFITLMIKGHEDLKKRLELQIRMLEIQYARHGVAHGADEAPWRLTAMERLFLLAHAGDAGDAAALSPSLNAMKEKRVKDKEVSRAESLYISNIFSTPEQGARSVTDSQYRKACGAFLFKFRVEEIIFSQVFDFLSPRSDFNLVNLSGDTIAEKCSFLEVELGRLTIRSPEEGYQRNMLLLYLKALSKASPSFDGKKSPQSCWELYLASLLTFVLEKEFLTLDETEENRQSWRAWVLQFASGLIMLKDSGYVFNIPHVWGRDLASDSAARNSDLEGSFDRSESLSRSASVPSSSMNASSSSIDSAVSVTPVPKQRLLPDDCLIKKIERSLTAYLQALFEKHRCISIDDDCYKKARVMAVLLRLIRPDNDFTEVLKAGLGALIQERKRLAEVMASSQLETVFSSQSLPKQDQVDAAVKALQPSIEQKILSWASWKDNACISETLSKAIACFKQRLCNYHKPRELLGIIESLTKDQTFMSEIGQSLFDSVEIWAKKYGAEFNTLCRELDKLKVNRNTKTYQKLVRLAFAALKCGVLLKELQDVSQSDRLRQQGTVLKVIVQEVRYLQGFIDLGFVDPQGNFVALVNDCRSYARLLAEPLELDLQGLNASDYHPLCVDESGSCNGVVAYAIACADFMRLLEPKLIFSKANSPAASVFSLCYGEINTRLFSLFPMIGKNFSEAQRSLLLNKLSEYYDYIFSEEALRIFRIDWNSELTLDRFKPLLMQEIAPSFVENFDKLRSLCNTATELSSLRRLMAHFLDSNDQIMQGLDASIRSLLGKHLAQAEEALRLRR